VVNACDNHKWRMRDETGKVLLEFRLCELLSNIFIEDEIEFSALEVSGAWRPAECFNKDINRTLRYFLVREISHAPPIFNDINYPRVSSELTRSSRFLRRFQHCPIDLSHSIYAAFGSFRVDAAVSGSFGGPNFRDFRSHHALIGK